MAYVLRLVARPNKRRLELPWPPSVNGYWTPWRGRMVLGPRGRAYRAEVLVATQGVAGVGSARLTVLLVARPPDRRRRDLDNLAKAVLDGMQGPLYDDDSQIDNLIIRRGATTPGGLVEVTLWPAVR